jgi:integrase
VLRTHFNAARDAHNAEQVKAKGPTLTGFVFHDLRKTALTRVGRAGATGAELMRWGGHADLEAVQIYQRADLDGLARLADTMDADVVVPGPVAPVSDINSRKAS